MHVILQSKIFKLWEFNTRSTLKRNFFLIYVPNDHEHKRAHGRTEQKLLPVHASCNSIDMYKLQVLQRRMICTRAYSRAPLWAARIYSSHSRYQLFQPSPYALGLIAGNRPARCRSTNRGLHCGGSRSWAKIGTNEGDFQLEPAGITGEPHVSCRRWLRQPRRTNGATIVSVLGLDECVVEERNQAFHLNQTGMYREFDRREEEKQKASKLVFERLWLLRKALYTAKKIGKWVLNSLPETIGRIQSSIMSLEGGWWRLPTLPCYRISFFNPFPLYCNFLR